MAYRELIKDFCRIREYLRDFYVYGFKLRSDFTGKSARSYDNERRRVESWMGDYVSFTQDSRGKRVFLSMDSRTVPHNPLYRAFKAKSFTHRDIMLHFCLMDLMREHGELELRQVLSLLEESYPRAIGNFVMDEKTVRLKLQELAELGLLEKQRRGKMTVYRLEAQTDLPEELAEAVDFFSEAMPLGVVGSYIADKLKPRQPLFRFKHHYPMQAIDSEILAQLLEAIRCRCRVELTVVHPALGEKKRVNTPLKIYLSTENGREYVLCWSETAKQYYFTRLDRIAQVKLLTETENWDQLRGDFERMAPHIWGISCRSEKGSGIHWLEMDIVFAPEEDFILRRLEREKRCASLVKLEEGKYRVRAEVYDPYEMMPWIFSFTGRIARLESSDPRVTERYRQYLQGLEDMYAGT